MRYLTALTVCGLLSLNFSFALAEDHSGKTAGTVELPQVQDLSALADTSHVQQLPILLMYAAQDCEYCEQLEKDIIRPMLISGELGKKVIFRKVMIDSFDSIKDFHGQAVYPDEFAYGKGVQVTPTLQLVDHQGEELVPKLIGYQSGEFFSAYLDSAIVGSQQLLLKR